MQTWYDRNSEHPYPSYDTSEVMAKAGGGTIEQVKKWFANRRKRSNNTKSLCEIAKRRKTFMLLSPYIVDSLTRDMRHAVWTVRELNKHYDLL